MNTKNDNKMAYLLGGTAAGIAASFLIGKIIKSTSRVQAETSRTAINNNEKIIKYSQDDNINNLCHPNDIHCNCEHSQSTLKYENVDWKGQSINNINYITLKQKHNQTKQKDYYHNINVEDNTEIEYLNIKHTPTINKRKLLECSDRCTNSFNDDLQSSVTNENLLKNKVNNYSCMSTYNINSQSSDGKMDKHLHIAQCFNKLNNIDVISPEKQN